MKVIADPAKALSHGLDALRAELQVPRGFPPDILAAAEAAAKRAPSEHADWTARPFVTLDPASSTDLDQAFAIEPSGRDILLHYAIADVAWFVDDHSPLDREAWRRGTTLYLPDGKANLYPPVLSEGAASLLPDQVRPAVIFTVRVAPDGGTMLDGVTRAVIRSRAKLAYETVRDGDLPDGFAELARRVIEAEHARGAARVDPPEQEVSLCPDGRFALTFRQRRPAEDQNAALSLAANLAVAGLLQQHRTGLFRVMEAPGERAISRLRHTARAFGLVWPANKSLAEFERTLNPSDPGQAAFMLAIRRASAGASYMTWQDGVVPWHAAMAATYTHATAPLRRLADRYVIRAALALSKGEAVPETVSSAFAALPPVMARADGRGARAERAAIDLAEAVMLAGREGEHFAAIVTDRDERGARIQLEAQAIVARVAAPEAMPGDEIRVRLTGADPSRRTLAFELAAPDTL